MTGTVLIIAASMFIEAAPSIVRAAVDSGVKVSATGLTHLSTNIEGTTVAADIVMRIPPRVEPGVATACTQSRIPCSLVSELRIRVGEAYIHMPRSVATRLADVNRASLHEIAAGRFELLLECGDASEAFEAHVLFDDGRVTQLDIIDGEAKMLAERTIFADVSHAFDD